MKMRALTLATFLVVGVAGLSPVGATTMVSLSMEQLTQASSDIVEGQVASQISEWNAAHTQIVTITTFKVVQTLKGRAANNLRVRLLGGTVGHVTVTVPGQVTFRPKREYILFLEPADDATYHVVGMIQGAYPIYRDVTANEERVILPSNLSYVQSVVGGAGDSAGTVPLLGFHKYVATLVGAGIHLPRGLRMPVAIASTESRGVGRLHVYGKTTAQLFPTKSVVIPAGTEVEGEAVRSDGSWTIYWDEVSVRGVHAPISAISHEAEGSLRGRILILSVR